MPVVRVVALHSPGDEGLAPLANCSSVGRAAHYPSSEYVGTSRAAALVVAHDRDGAPVSAAMVAPPQWPSLDPSTTLVQVATLGPRGTSSEEAARYFCRSIDASCTGREPVILLASFEQAAAAVVDGDASHLVVANAYSSVNKMYMDLRLELAATFVLDTPDYGIAACPDRPISIAPVLATHPAPEPLVQQLLPDGFPRVSIRLAPSTAAAALAVIANEAELALTTKPAADLHGLQFVSRTRRIRMVWSVFVAARTEHQLQTPAELLEQPGRMASDSHDDEESSRRAHLAAVGAVVLAASIWSSSYTATKLALETLPPLTIGFLRFALAAAVLAVLVRIGNRLVRPKRSDIVSLAAAGLLGTTFYFAIENVGIHLADASDAALLVAAYPAITIGLELVIYRRRAPLVKVAGVALAVVGVYLIVGSPAGGAAPQRLVGDALLVVSGVVWALYNFVTRSLTSRYPVLTIVYYQTVVGAAAFVPLALLERDRWVAPNLSTSMMVLHLGLTCSVVAFVCYARGLRHLNASAAVSVLNLVPVFGVLFAVTVLGEPVGASQWIGGGIVLAGVALATRSGKRRSDRQNGKPSAAVVERTVYG